MEKNILMGGTSFLTPIDNIEHEFYFYPDMWRRARIMSRFPTSNIDHTMFLYELGKKDALKHIHVFAKHLPLKCKL